MLTSSALFIVITLSFMGGFFFLSLQIKHITTL
ncbi:hypothetical protein EV199_1572 [Pseudobacter ginsenosidimutans]|uniref:Uncharacterized protein n=1 Tax=Pseudobacter ginsenosidimutans TaxID=661488 RepID=A0A4Q7N3Z7_9BACT|nr:hypothetical protein EV199_1572 [Pseudobacter ginsenosidimutans]